MQNNPLKWYKVTVVFYICCLLFTTINLYNSYKYYIVISESLICIFFILLGVSKINKISELTYNHIKYLFSKKYRLAFAITFCILSLGISYVLGLRTNSEIEKNGITTEAIIQSQLKTTKTTYQKPVNSYTIDILFSTKEGKEYTISKSIDKAFYDKNLASKKVKIRYLPNNPSIFKII